LLVLVRDLLEKNCLTGLCGDKLLKPVGGTTFVELERIMGVRFNSCAAENFHGKYKSLSNQCRFGGYVLRFLLISSFY
jgi:hypothetical protein